MEAGRNSSSVLGALKKAFITIGMVLFVIVAFRNSLVWYVTKVWSSSHDFWSYLWAAVFRASGESDFVMAVVCERLQQNQLMITHRFTTDVARVTCTSPLLPPPHSLLAANNWHIHCLQCPVCHSGPHWPPRLAEEVQDTG